MSRRLVRADYAAAADALARRLLGAVIVHRTPGGTRVAGVIVETEAYLGTSDLASHAAGGRRTPRNDAMYAAPGTAYVYFTYGMHHCFNVVCGAEGEPAAVLIRAIAPTQGLSLMRRRRRAARRAAAAIPDARLADGPGKLCRALGIDLRHNHADLTADRRLWIEPAPGPAPSDAVARTARIGVGYAGEWARAPLRFVLTTPPPRHESSR